MRNEQAFKARLAVSVVLAIAATLGASSTFAQPVDTARIDAGGQMIPLSACSAGKGGFECSDQTFSTPRLVCFLCTSF